MKKLKKLTMVLMISILISMQFMFLTGGSSKAATTLNVNKASLYSKGEVVLCSYNGTGIIVDLVFHKVGDIEYPAYCIDKGSPGVTEGKGYTVSIDKLLTDNRIWRAISNGYPFKSVSELGCDSVAEAFVATKMALYHTYYGYNVSSFGNYENKTSNTNVVKAIKKICANADKAGISKIGAVLDIKEDTQEWKVDSKDPKYVSKTYSITASASYSTYNVSMSGNDISYIKIVDENNQPASTFQANKKFKVIIPIAELEKSGEFTLKASANLKTLPILYGKAPNSTWQDYAVTAGSYELTDDTLTQRYYENKTKIEITKKDGDKSTPLANAKFTLLDANREVAHSEITTDEEGVCTIEHLTPGTYYLKEIQAPNGYYGYEDTIEINVKLNEKVVINIDNFKKPETIEEEKPQDESHVSYGERQEIKTLPRTGC